MLGINLSIQHIGFDATKILVKVILRGMFDLKIGKMGYNNNTIASTNCDGFPSSTTDNYFRWF